MTIRKNFLLDDEIANHLEEIAKKENTTQSKIIRNLIEEKYEDISVKDKLDAFGQILQSVEKSGTNPFLEQFDTNDTKIVQKVKGMMK
jgi:predicted transcriptional regulator